LVAHRCEGFDKRNEASTYLILHKPGWMCNKWSLIPVNDGNEFYISLAVDEYGYDKKDMKGWKLSVHDAYSKDVREKDQSLYSMVHNDGHGGKTWLIE